MKKKTKNFMRVQDCVAALVDEWPGDDRVFLGISTILNGLALIRQKEGKEMSTKMLTFAVEEIIRLHGEAQRGIQLSPE